MYWTGYETITSFFFLYIKIEQKPDMKLMYVFVCFPFHIYFIQKSKMFLILNIDFQANKDILVIIMLINWIVNNWFYVESNNELIRLSKFIVYYEY